MVERKYSFGTSVLQQALTLILLNCAKYIGAFGAFKSKYDDAYLDALRAELAAAEMMKSEQARSLEHEALRVAMLPMADNCRGNWQALKRYIAEAFGADLEVQNWDAAGWQLYSESVSSWDKLVEMCGIANVYLTDNEAVLTDRGYMPADFKDIFANASAEFMSTYNLFLLAKENAMQGTEDKVAAYNAIYVKMVSLCEDGQYIFRKDEVKRRQFSMEAVSELIKPVGAAGLKGTVTKDGKAQAGLIVELENESLHVVTDADGAFDFGNRLASGTDTLIIRNGDEILAEEEVVINPGVTKRENVVLPVPVVANVETTTPTAPTA